MKKRILAVIAAAGAALLISTGASAATMLQAATDPAADCILVAAEGDYNGSASVALARINEIRKEACDEGIQDPRDKTGSTNLTASDYVPIRWSSSLEYIARIRAAEASLLIGHERPNGNPDRCFSVIAPDGQQSWGENLAWNWMNTMVSGVEQWYEEKADWVNQTQEAVTGHYTSMIDPDNLYVGLACFTSPFGVYRNTVSGEFSRYGTHSETISAAAPGSRVVLEVQAAALSKPQVVIKDKKVQTSAHYDKGDVLSCDLALTSSFNGREATVFDAGTITWTSSNPAVAAVSSNGLVQIKGAGTATITAASSSGNSGSLTVAAAHEFGEWKTEKLATVFAAGSRTRTCSVCGEIQTQAIAKLTPKLTIGKKSVSLKKTKTIAVKYTVARGDMVSVKTTNKKIATAKVQNGKIVITAKKKAGKAKIYVRTKTGRSAAIKVTVKKAKTTKIKCSSVSVKKNRTKKLKVTIIPAYSDDKVTYTIKDKKIASVNSKGVVRGKKKGETKLTIRSGKKAFTIKVKVK